MQKLAILKKGNVLNDKGIGLKVYWTVLNNFQNTNKILSVSLIFMSGKTITIIVEKANIFNEFFAS